MIPAAAQRELIELLGPQGYLDQPEDLILYEYDGSVDMHRPDMVVFPRSTEDVVGIARIAHRHDVPVVGRGAGTGLSGGAIPREGGVVVGFARMNRILAIDLENERAIVQPGVVNLDITLAVQQQRYFFAPDPSSQRACTIGGNVAENAGGPHTLAYGVTTNHVMGLEAVLPDGTLIETGGLEPDLPGYDLTGLLTGSEGTMTLFTKVMVRLMRQPEAVKTCLAIYDSAEAAGNTVAEITACGITPVAVEMLDGVMLRMVEEATHAGYPMDASAVLLIELEGLREGVEEQGEQVRDACLRSGAREFRVARSAEERDLLWKAAKMPSGPSAVCRLSTMCRTVWCLAVRSRRRYWKSSGSPKSTASPSAISFTRGTVTCIRSFSLTRANPAIWRRRAMRAKRFSITAFPSADPSLESMVWGWRRSNSWRTSFRATV
jgi:glycolate oxidase